eukprot:36826-Rhodomonas_salina.1
MVNRALFLKDSTGTGGLNCSTTTTGMVPGVSPSQRSLACPSPTATTELSAGVIMIVGTRQSQYLVWQLVGCGVIASQSQRGCAKQTGLCFRAGRNFSRKGWNLHYGISNLYIAGHFTAKVETTIKLFVQEG